MEDAVFTVSAASDMLIDRIDQDIVVVDNFYRFPLDVRAFALSLDFSERRSLYSSYWTESRVLGCRSLVETFEGLLGVTITDWDSRSLTDSNGSFFYVTRDTAPVVHADQRNRFGGVLYLVPDAPPERGTGFFRHTDSGLIRSPTAEDFQRIGPQRLDHYRRRDLWREGHPSRLEAWTLTHEVANKFNRLVLFRADRFHSGLGGFGTTKHDSRLYQTFFFS
jgi:hypothetical protein